jgi:hypothetical protein
MRNHWTQEEIAILKELFSDNYTAEIARKLNRKYSSVAHKANTIGLKKSEAFRKKDLQRSAEMLKIAGAKCRFKKGMQPHNKGKPLPPKIKEKLKSTQFKKGNLPHNIKYDGHERIDKYGYVFIRISKGKYVQKHRYVWEQIHGPIPDGLLVTFKDGNKQNCVLENLELKTKQQHMESNTIARFPKELISTIKLHQKIKTIINAKEQNRRSS